MNIGRGSVVVGMLMILHAGMGSAHHRANLRLSEQPYDGLPVDITTQCVIGFVIACFGISKVAGEFKDISATNDLNRKTLDSITNVPSFYHFAHRGRSIHSIIYS